MRRHGTGTGGKGGAPCPGLRSITVLGIFAGLWAASGARAQDADPAPPPVRPAIKFNRWQEDWSALADPALRTQPGDDLKYVPLLPGDARSYLSLGMNLRERFESNDAPFFGVGGRAGDSYVIQRLETSLDIHPDAHWQVFAQLEDARAFGKATITAVDQDVLDLEQAFVAYTTDLGPGQVKIKAGRQEIGFDLQRFVAVRDGPNVRQAFDALWVDYEVDLWRVISFWSHPVQYRGDHVFDDYSNTHFQYGGFRVERQKLGPGDLSAYYSRWQQDNARFLDGAGPERRDIFDVRYAGKADGLDWDVEVMEQTGGVGRKSIQAWAVGSLSGYTLDGMPWQPRLGVQADVASGDRHPGDGTVGTFNPLFPNGYYFTLAGYTGSANVMHLKPSLTVHPAGGLAVMAASGLQWRQTTADAIYVQPNLAVPGTAGQGGRWTGIYGQLRADYALTANVATAVEAVHFAIGDTLRRAGGRDSDYLGIELKLGW